MGQLTSNFRYEENLDPDLFSRSGANEAFSAVVDEYSRILTRMVESPDGYNDFARFARQMREALMCTSPIPDKAYTNFLSELIFYSLASIKYDFNNYYRFRRDKLEKSKAFEFDDYFIVDCFPAVAEKLRDRILLDNIRAIRAKANQLSKPDRNALSIGSGQAVRESCEILNIEFARLGLLDLLEAKYGMPYQVTGLCVELSHPKFNWWSGTHEKASRKKQQCHPTAYAHLDESFAHPKAILYLTDVGRENGPTSVYPGIYDMLDINSLADRFGRIIGLIGSDTSSPFNQDYRGRSYHQPMSSPLLRSLFDKLPANAKFHSHFGWDIDATGPLACEMISREVVVTGPTGTGIIFDGAQLVHRGGQITNGERIALQIIFGPRKSVTSRLLNRILSVPLFKR